MSHNYIHYDLNNMIKKYFDNKKEKATYTENYRRCIYRHNDGCFVKACEKGNINIIKHLMNQTIKDLTFDGFILACIDKNFELMNFFLGHTSDVDELINKTIKTGFSNILNEFFDKSLIKHT